MKIVIQWLRPDRCYYAENLQCT